jgi:iron complex transport system substrate-binding protein
MRVFGFILAASLAATVPAEAAAPRAASLSLCTDELLLMMAEPEQIASVTYLSQQPLESPLWRQARRYPANDGSLLSVVGRWPELVVGMGGGGRDADRIAHRLGIRLLMLPQPQSLHELKQVIRTLATALGRPTPGALLQARIARLERSAPAARVDAAWLGGGGLSLDPGGIGSQWMALAGMKQRALAGNRLTLEQLAVRPPVILLRSDYRERQYSSQQDWLQHPLLARRGKWRTLATDGRRWTCMGPLLIGEVERLRKAVQ